VPRLAAVGAELDRAERVLAGRAGSRGSLREVRPGFVRFAGGRGELHDPGSASLVGFVVVARDDRPRLREPIAEQHGLVGEPDREVDLVGLAAGERRPVVRSGDVDDRRRPGHRDVVVFDRVDALVDVRRERDAVGLDRTPDVRRNRTQPGHLRVVRNALVDRPGVPLFGQRLVRGIDLEVANPAVVVCLVNPVLFGNVAGVGILCYVLCEIGVVGTEGEVLEVDLVDVVHRLVLPLPDVELLEFGDSLIRVDPLGIEEMHRASTRITRRDFLAGDAAALAVDEVGRG